MFPVKPKERPPEPLPDVADLLLSSGLVSTKYVENRFPYIIEEIAKSPTKSRTIVKERNSPGKSI